MKKLTFIALMLHALCAQTQWSINAYLQDGPVSFVEALSEDVILRYGDGYSIYRTETGGIWWEEIPNDFEYSFMVDVSFLDDQIGFSCGGTWFGTHWTCLMKTEDGGQTWDTISSNNPDVNSMFYNRCHFVNENIGFLTLDGDGMVKTNDGGETFSLIEFPSELDNYRVLDVDFATENTGFVSVHEYSGFTVGEHRYVIYKTIDQGESWVEVYSDYNEEVTTYNTRLINRLDVFDENHIYGVGSNSSVVSSMDGGASWTYSSLAPYTSNLNVCEIVSPTTGFINNAGIVHKTTDGGQTWYIQTATPVNLCNDISMLSEDVGFFIAPNALYKTTSGGEVVNIEEFENRSIKIYPNPADDQFSIDMMNPELVESVVLYDMQGNQVEYFDDQLKDIDISHLGSGTYVLAVTKCYEVFREVLVIN